MEQNKKCRSCSKEPEDRLNIARFIAALDKALSKGDLESAQRVLEFWHSEAIRLCDKRALLTILNEELGFYRRVSNEKKALEAIEATLELLKDAGESLSSAVIYTNLATTLKAFKRPQEALLYYSRAEELYTKNNGCGSFEYAALLNNKSSSLSDLGRFHEAKDCLLKAIELLKKEGEHDGEIALSLLSLAHAEFDSGCEDFEKIEKLIDSAWDYICSPRQKKDSNYAFIISKCAPSFRYFKRELEADALDELSREIYGGLV